MIEPEVKQNVEESDRQLEAIIKELDRLVGKNNYVLALTADHGMTPLPESVQNWSINMREMSDDIEKTVRLDDAEHPVGPVEPRLPAHAEPERIEAERRHGRGRRQVPQRLSDRGQQDDGTTSRDYFEGREEERLFMFAATAEEIDDAIDCASRGAAEAQATARTGSWPRARGTADCRPGNGATCVWAPATDATPIRYRAVHPGRGARHRSGSEVHEGAHSDPESRAGRLEVGGQPLLLERVPHRDHHDLGPRVPISSRDDTVLGAGKKPSWTPATFRSGICSAEDVRGDLAVPGRAPRK